MEILILLTIAIGLVGVLLRRNLLMKILAMDIMSTGVISYFVLIAARKGTFTPTLVDSPSGVYADPVPQAVILTAIVIGFSILALLLVCVMALSREFPTLDSDDIERRYRP